MTSEITGMPREAESGTSALKRKRHDRNERPLCRPFQRASLSVKESSKCVSADMKSNS